LRTQYTRVVFDPAVLQHISGKGENARYTRWVRVYPWVGLIDPTGFSPASEAMNGGSIRSLRK